MIPADVDMNSLATQLRAGEVAFGTANPANPALGEHISATLHSVDTAGMGPVGVVVLESTPAHPADLRDIAQDLADATERDTVVVRTPQASGAVSHRLTRAEVERGQRAMMTQPDYGDGIRAFAEDAHAGGMNWAVVAFATVVALAVVAAATAALTRRMVRD
ncbi:DUF6676 family protein [Corynebacterium sp. UBA2622]|uniref:Rv1476 family membrane protein n=1 Tax=Corynebacterium sp. UBA2622 TaxID=1946393 RepID=UPI0025C17877|nr:DUF6676 family protein [Corynebacterium sp. UBA2622]